MNVTIKFRDGTEREFKETSRPGGSACTTVEYRQGWLLVKDAWDTTVSFPADSVAEVQTRESRGW